MRPKLTDKTHRTQTEFEKQLRAVEAKIAGLIDELRVIDCPLTDPDGDTPFFGIDEVIVDLGAIQERLYDLRFAEVCRSLANEERE